jgi:hypothetical protein
LKRPTTAGYILHVSSVTEIEAAILRLSREEFADLAAWFDEQRNRVWDCQIEKDSASGALDFLLKKVDEDIAKGGTRPPDELCDNR